MRNIGSRSRWSKPRRLIAGFLVVMLIATACGGDESAQRDDIRVQAETVAGERIVIDDLADTDTLLWFWAPW